MKSGLISIIVPIYKVEKFLRKCVDSIIAQTYKNIEIILVDDGSPDKCPEICDEYAKKDSRIRVIHQKNAGLSAARNSGIRVANGEYIGFIDGDDYEEPDMYEKMFVKISENHADLCICNYRYVDEDGNDFPINWKSPLKNECCTPTEAQRKLCEDGYWYYVTAVNKLYHNRLFKAHGFKDGILHEDEFIIHHIFDSCRKIVTISDELYNYVQRNNSITGNKENIHHLDGAYAMLDRYILFKRKYSELSCFPLRDAYYIEYNMLKKIRLHKWNAEYRKILSKVLLFLISEKDLRFVKLSMYCVIKF